MINPYPENMGFPLPKTIGEMLPDQPLTMPDGTRSRYKHISQANLHTYTCANCGKVFDAGPEYKYKKNGRHGRPQELFCCYPCFRPTERAMQEEFKRATLMGPYKGAEANTRYKARQRVKLCQARLAELEAQKQDADAWAALSPSGRQTLTKLIYRWKQKTDDALEALKEIEANEKTLSEVPVLRRRDDP